MLLNLCKYVPTLALFLTAHSLVVISYVNKQKQKLCVVLAAIFGLLNICVMRGTFNFNRPSPLILLLKCDIILYVWEIFMGVCSIIQYQYAGYYGFGIIACGVVLFLSNLIKFVLIRYYIDKNGYELFSDVLELEKFVIICRDGYKHFTDDAIVQNMLENKGGLDTRVLFCMWSNCNETRDRLDQEEALSFIKSKIEEVHKDITTDINEIGGMSHGIEKNIRVLDENEDDGSDAEIELDLSPDESSGDEDGSEEDEMEATTIQCGSKAEVERISWATESVEYDKVDKAYLVTIKREKLNEVALEGVITLKSIQKTLTEEDAKRCLKIITRGFMQMIKYEDFVEHMRELNKERGVFISAQAGQKIVQEELRKIFISLKCVGFLLIFMLLFTWNVNAKATVLPVLLFTVPPLWYFYMPFLYLVYHMPFRVGEKVVIKNEAMRVVEMRLCYTLFKDANKQFITIPNKAIYMSTVQNIYQSIHQTLLFKIKVANNTSRQIMGVLRHKMTQFGTDCGFIRKIEMDCTKVVDMNYYEMEMRITHPFNYSSGYFKAKAHDIFLHELIRQIEHLRIDGGHQKPRVTLVGKRIKFE